jgi:hypothetical protein
VSKHTLTIDCPICEDEIEVEVTVTHWGSRGSYWEPAEGPETEWEVPKECDSCKGSFSHEQYEELSNKIEKRVDDKLCDWEDDVGQAIADHEVDSYLEDLHYKNTTYGDGPL